mgnify:CR=1 FL=1
MEQTARLPKRNQACFCGSGLKYKKCHEWLFPANSGKINKKQFDWIMREEIRRAETARKVARAMIKREICTYYAEKLVHQYINQALYNMIG